MKIYISGDRRHARAFSDATVQLREKGYDPVNPLVYSSDTNDVTNTVSRILRLLRCEAIYLLPSWENSSKSRLEYLIASQTGKQILHGEGQFNKIQMAILQVTNVAWNEITGGSREHIYVSARMIFAYHAYTKSGCMKKVAHELNRDRSTVAYYLRKYDDDYHTYKPFRKIADQVICILDDISST